MFVVSWAFFGVLFLVGLFVLTINGAGPILSYVVSVIAASAFQLRLWQLSVVLSILFLAIVLSAFLLERCRCRCQCSPTPLLRGMLQTVRAVLSESSFHSEPDFVRILSGEEEGLRGFSRKWSV